MNLKKKVAENPIHDLKDALAYVILILIDDDDVCVPY